MLGPYLYKNKNKVVVNISYGFVMLGLALASAVSGESPPRGSLDSLWEKHMLEGTFVIMSFVNSKPSISMEKRSASVDPEEDELTFPTLMSHPISVMKLGEGLFRNGGWVLSGGLLRLISDGPSTIELYGKEVVRRFPHFPFPHRDFPQESSYEVFLLRRDSVGQAVVLGKWAIKPEDVIQKNPNYPKAKILLEYEKVARSATITITGLKHNFYERVDLSPKR